MTSDGCSDAAEVEEKVAVTLLLLEGISLVLRLLPWLPGLESSERTELID